MKLFAFALFESLKPGEPFSASEVAATAADPKKTQRAIRQLVRLFKVRRLRGGMLVRP